MIPLLATFLFSLNKQPDRDVLHRRTAYGYGPPQRASSGTAEGLVRCSRSRRSSISLVLFVPTVYWVHLKVPRLRPVLAFLALIPFVVPPIVMVVGLLDFYKGSPSWFYDQPWGFLAAAYVILAFPYMFFSLDAGFRSIDVHTLTEASQSLGARWPTTLGRGDPPEHPRAPPSPARSSRSRSSWASSRSRASPRSTRSRSTSSTVNESQAYGAAAVTVLSFGITWAAMLSLLVVGRKRGARAAVIAGVR